MLLTESEILLQDSEARSQWGKYSPEIRAALWSIRERTRILTAPCEVPRAKLQDLPADSNMLQRELPSHKQVSNLIGQMFESYVADALWGKRLGWRTPSPIHPDVILPFWDGSGRRLYVECKFWRGQQLLLKIIQASKQNPDGPLYCAFGFHSLVKPQKRIRDEWVDILKEAFPPKSIWIFPADAIRQWILETTKTPKRMKHYANGEHYLPFSEADARALHDSLSVRFPHSISNNWHAINLILEP